jgi:hypothetical protein
MREAISKALLAGFRAVSIEAGDWDEVTLSLLDLSKFGALERAVAAFAKAAQGKIWSVGPELGRCAGKSPSYGKAANPAEAMNLVAQVLGEKNRASTGLSIYFPARRAYYDAGYDKNGSPEWKALLSAYFGNGKVAEESPSVDSASFAYFVGKEPTGDYRCVDLVLAVDDEGEIVKESRYSEAANGTYGPFRPKKGSRIAPITEAFHGDDEESEFAALTDDVFDPAADFDSHAGPYPEALLRGRSFIMGRFRTRAECLRAARGLRRG